MNPEATRSEPAQLETLSLEAFDRALEACPWITPADLVTVNLARWLIVETVSSGDTKSGKLLLDVLTSLGMTVAGRAGKPEVESEDDPLERIRRRSNLRTHSAETPNP